jgi:hypothetical protein
MIEAVYTLTEEEFIEGSKIWCPQAVKKVPGYWPLQIFFFAFCAGIGLGLHYYPPKFQVVMAVLFFGWLGISQWRRSAARKYQYQSKSNQREEVSVKLDDVGYHDNKAGVCGGWIAWSGFTAWRETENIFLLGRDLNYVSIPKRPFTEEQQDEIREMIRANVQGKV